MKTRVLVAFLVGAQLAAAQQCSRPASLVVIEAQGVTPFAFGRSVGFASRFQIIARLATPEVATAASFAATATGAAAVAALLAASNATFPQFVDELAGLAAGAGISLADAFLLNIIDELETIMPPSRSPRASHCTDVLLGPPSAASSVPRLIAHNEDATVADGDLMFLLDASAPGGISFTAYMYAGALASGAFAFNDAGVFFTTNALFPLTLVSSAVPRAFLQRHLIEARSLTDALARIGSAPVACGFAVNLGAIGSRELHNIELSAVVPPDDALVGAAEHLYHANEYDRSPTPQTFDASSHARLARLAELPVPAPGDAAGARLLLGDTFNATYPVWRTGAAPDCCETVVTALFSVVGDGKGGEAGTLSIFGDNPRDCPIPLLVRSIAAGGTNVSPPRSPPSPPLALDRKNGTGAGYSFYCLGIDCTAAPPPPASSPGTVLMGGGSDVDAAFLHQIAYARGGAFIIIRADSPDDPAYNDYVWGLAANASLPLFSVTTIILHGPRGGEQPFVQNAVSNASAVFFSGGDQTHYVRRINGGSLAPILVALATRATIGGTSAGSDYQGQLVFAPPFGAPDVTTPIALADPYAPGITFAVSAFDNPAFATGGVRRVLVDAHFVTEDRMGRNLAFLSRLVTDGNVSVAGGGCAYLVATDEATAWLIDPATGAASLASDTPTPLYSTGYVCSLCSAPTLCAPGSPLTAGPFACLRLDAARNDTYNFHAWNGTGVAYPLTVEAGVVVGSPYGPGGPSPLPPRR